MTVSQIAQHSHFFVVPSAWDAFLPISARSSLTHVWGTLNIPSPPESIPRAPQSGGITPWGYSGCACLFNPWFIQARASCLPNWDVSSFPQYQVFLNSPAPGSIRPNLQWYSISAVGLNNTTEHQSSPHLDIDSQRRQPGGIQRFLSHSREQPLTNAHLYSNAFLKKKQIKLPLTVRKGKKLT